MATATADMKTLKKEMILLRSFLIGVAGKDREGAYRSEFVERILGTMNDQPKHRFGGARAFLKQLEA